MALEEAEEGGGAKRGRLNGEGARPRLGLALSSVSGCCQSGLLV